METHAFAFAISFVDKASPKCFPILRSSGLQPIDANNLALMEAIYNGGCGKSAEFLQISSANGLVAMTGINVPRKNFSQSSLAKKPLHKLTTREKAEYIADLRDQEILFVLITRR